MITKELSWPRLLQSPDKEAHKTISQIARGGFMYVPERVVLFLAASSRNFLSESGKLLDTRIL